MTNREAIIRLRMMLAEVGGMSLVSDDDCTAVNIAIEALEKQIPQKPYFVSNYYTDGMPELDTIQCPKCATEYSIDNDDYDYCPKCGQRIDWDDEK